MLQDIGIGFIVGVITCLCVGNPENFLIFLVFSAVMSVAPDVDYWIYMVQNDFKIDRWTYQHRHILHHPPLWLAVGMWIYFNVDPIYGFLFIMNTMIHFIHDTYTAFGIAWFGPFLNWYFILSKDCPKKIVKGKKELRKLVLIYGRDDWLKREYGDYFNLFSDWYIILKKDTPKKIIKGEEALNKLLGDNVKKEGSELKRELFFFKSGCIIAVVYIICRNFF